MKTKYLLWAGLLALGLAPQLRAQAPIPAVPVIPVVPVTPVGAAAVTPTRNIWSMMCMTPEQRLLCRDRWCRTGLGQMLAGAAGPVGMMTGGLCVNRCLLPSALDLARPADSAAGAAARIAADELDAKARREAVRYLGTVDCHWWPEAQDALINALRADRNECVRFEAALSLGRGCCCTPKTIEALSLTVSGSERDGNPAENSERVRNAAADALAHCSAAYHNFSEPGPIQEKEILPDPKKVQQSPSDYYKKVAQMPREQILENARQALAHPDRKPRGSDGVAGIFTKAFVPKTNNGTQTAAADPNTPLIQIPEVKLPPQGTPVQYETPVAPQTIPAQTIPSQTVPVQTIPSQTVPPRTVPPRTIPTQTVPAQTGPAQTVPAQPMEVPAQTAPASNDQRRAPDGLLNILGRRIQQGRTPTPPQQPSGPESSTPMPAPLAIPANPTPR